MVNYIQRDKDSSLKSKNMSENVLSVSSATTEDEESSCEDIIEQSSAVQPCLILIRRRTALLA